jgi:hypothetical protein
MNSEYFLAFISIFLSGICVFGTGMKCFIDYIAKKYNHEIRQDTIQDTIQDI